MKIINFKEIEKWYNENKLEKVLKTLNNYEKRINKFLNQFKTGIFYSTNDELINIITFEKFEKIIDNYFYETLPTIEINNNIIKIYDNTKTIKLIPLEIFSKKELIKFIKKYLFKYNIDYLKKLSKNELINYLYEKIPNKFKLFYYDKLPLDWDYYL